MKIIIDERERDLYDIFSATYNQDAWEKSTLSLGDIIIRGDDEKDIIIIERKTILDLLSSINDGRYKEQSFRLQHSSGLPPHRIVYIIEGIFQGQSQMDKQIVYSAMVSLNQYKGFSVIRTLSTQETADFVKHLMDKIKRETQKGKNMYLPLMATTETAPYSQVIKSVKKENITKENIGVIMLSQIPGISSSIAQILIKDFSSFTDFLIALRTDSSFLNSIVIPGPKPRKLGKNIIESLNRLCL